MSKEAETSMAKAALCVRKSDVHIDLSVPGISQVPVGFLGINTELVDRDICETDETRLQLITYVLLRSPSGRIFCYERGSGGSESRLHAKLSIGLGGHVDVKPQPGLLANTLYLEAEREVREEVGLRVHINDFEGVLYAGEGADPVDRVHLGILCQAVLDRGCDVSGTEPGIIERGSWRSLNDLRVPEAYERLECWSKLVVDYLSSEADQALASGLYAVADLMAEVGAATGSVTQVAAPFLAAAAQSIMYRGQTARLYDDGLVYALTGRIRESFDEYAFQTGVARRSA